MINLGTQSLGIGLAIHLRDKFTQRSQAITRQMRMMHGNALKVQKENLHAMNRLGYGMTIAGGALTMGFAKSVKAAADFQFLMKGIQAITQISNSELVTMSNLALKLGRETIYTADEVGSAMEFIARQGLTKPKQIYSVIDAVVALGAATDKAIGGKGGVADYMLHIMHGFNIGVEGASRVANVMTKATLLSSSDVEDMHEALKHFSGTARTLGVTLEESLAMVATLSNAGLRGGMGGRSINNMLLYLSTAVGKFRTNRQVEAMRAIGLTVKDIVDSKGNIRPIIDLVNAFGKNLKHLPKVDQVSALKQLLNIRGERAIFPLIENSKLGLDFATILGQITTNSSNLAENISKMRMNNLKGDFMILADTWKTFQIEIGSTLEPLVRWGTKFVTKVLNKIMDFARTPLGKPFVILAAAGALALGVSGALLVAFTSIKLMTLGSTVTFANMGRTLALAWNTGTAAALRYATTAKGATMVNTPGGPRWRGANGRWTKGAKGLTVTGGLFGSGGWFKSMGLFMKNLSSASGLLGMFGRGLRFLTGMGGVVIGVFTYIVGFRNIIKLMVFGLGTLLNSIIFAGQAIWAVMKNAATPWRIPGDYRAAKKRFNTSQENMKEMFGIRRLDPGGLSVEKPRDNSIGLQQLFDAQQARFEASRKNKKTEVNLHMDGKKIGALTLEQALDSVRTSRPPLPIN